MQFIDIHGHYAWGIDDGIPTQDEAIKALQMAKENNICTIVATPHVVPGTHNETDIQHFKERIAKLKALAQNENIEVYEGCELFLNHDYINSINQQLFIPIENTSYLLVEFDVRKEIGKEYEVEDYLYEIDIKGYTPIIAHAERYFPHGIDLQRIEQWIDSGYVIQVNASSLLGVHGKTVKNNAYQLLNNGLIHIIATDTHRSQGHRIPCLQEIHQLLSKKYDYQTLKTLMYDNPLHILQNESVEMIQVNQSFFKKLFKRR